MIIELGRGRASGRRRPKVNGGEIVAVGTPEEVVKAATGGSAGGTSGGVARRSYTGRYLKPLLERGSGVRSGAKTVEAAE